MALSYQPSDPQARGPSSFPLSDLDLLMHNVLVPVAVIFRLDDSSKSGRERIVQSLKLGLEKTAAQIPSLTGRVVASPGAQRFEVKTYGHDDGIRLYTSGVDEIVRDVAAHDELATAHFAPYTVPFMAILPAVEFGPAKVGDDETASLPACVFQVTFIQNGLILGAAFHHLVCDSPGYDLVFRTWAAHARGVEPEPVALDRSILSGTSALAGGQLHALEQDLASRGAAMETSIPNPTNLPLGPMPCVTGLVRIPLSSLSRLRDDAVRRAAGLPISIGDCLAALLWRSITRARASLPRYAGATETRFYQAIGFRSREACGVPSNYFGNAASFGRVDAWPVAALLQDGSLLDAASAIRRTVQNFDAAFLKDLLRWSGSLDDPSKRIWSSVPLGKMDFSASSWSGITAYDTYDFGFGLPSAYRVPEGGSEWVSPLPARKDADGTVYSEVFLGLPNDVHDFLSKDDEFRRYAVVYQLP